MGVRGKKAKRQQQRIHRLVVDHVATALSAATCASSPSLVVLDACNATVAGRAFWLSLIPRWSAVQSILCHVAADPATCVSRCASRLNHPVLAVDNAEAGVAAVMRKFDVPGATDAASHHRRGYDRVLRYALDEDAASSSLFNVIASMLESATGKAASDAATPKVDVMSLLRWVADATRPLSFAGRWLPSSAADIIDVSIVPCRGDPDGWEGAIQDFVADALSNADAAVDSTANWRLASGHVSWIRPYLVGSARKRHREAVSDEGLIAAQGGATGLAPRHSADDDTAASGKQSILALFGNHYAATRGEEAKTPRRHVTLLRAAVKTFAHEQDIVRLFSVLNDRRCAVRLDSLILDRRAACISVGRIELAVVAGESAEAFTTVVTPVLNACLSHVEDGEDTSSVPPASPPFAVGDVPSRFLHVTVGHVGRVEPFYCGTVLPQLVGRRDAGEHAQGTARVSVAELAFIPHKEGPHPAGWWLEGRVAVSRLRR